MTGAARAVDAPPWRGIWAGSIGTQQVMVCLDTVEDNAGSPSAYYYLKHGATIALALDGTRWTEGDAEHKTGSWQLDAAGADGLAGVWSAPGGQKSLPIALSRVQASPDDFSSSEWGEHALCRSLAFYGPRADAEKVVAGAAQSFGGRHFRDLYAQSFIPSAKSGEPRVNSTVELLAPGPHTAQINGFLRARWRGRLARSYIHDGGLGEFSESVEGYTDRWLTLREMELPAGYAWSSASMWHETWSLQTGKQVDLWSWFNAKGGRWQPSEINPQAGLVFNTSPALLALAKRRVSQDPECKDKDISLDDPRLVAAGMQFSTGFGPCKQDFVLSFQSLRPFLNRAALAETAPSAR